MKWNDIKDDYQEGYQRHFNQIDSEVAAETPCEKCGGTMAYIGYKNKSEYVAFAVCQKCDEAIDF